ncbi:hypothetical protein GOODEAATRI_028631, partial [Goodea atripinnis]
ENPIQPLTSHLPIKPLLLYLPQPHLPHTITTIITTITTPIIITTTPRPHALPALLPLVPHPTMPTLIAPAPQTHHWAPLPTVLTAHLSPHTPRHWASHFLIRVLQLLKCSTDWSARPLRQLEQMRLV